MRLGALIYFPVPYTLLLTHYTGPEKQLKSVAVLGDGFHDTLALL